MKKLILLNLVVSTILFASNGKTLFMNNCVSCHIIKKGWQLNSKEKANMLAPTAFGITKHTFFICAN